MAFSIKLLLKDRRPAAKHPPASHLDNFKKELKHILKNNQASTPSKRDFEDYKAYVSDMMDKRFAELAQGLHMKGVIDHIPGITSPVTSQLRVDEESEGRSGKSHGDKSLDDFSMSDVEATNIPT